MPDLEASDKKAQITVIGGDTPPPHSKRKTEMKLATFATSALATVLVAGSAFAYSPSDERANVPTRDYDLGYVTAQPTDGQKTTVKTSDVYDSRDAALIGEETVNEYVFTSDNRDNDDTAFGNRYR